MSLRPLRAAPQAPAPASPHSVTSDADLLNDARRALTDARDTLHTWQRTRAATRRLRSAVAENRAEFYHQLNLLESTIQASNNLLDRHKEKSTKAANR
jgi:hypothetical protein